MDSKSIVKAKGIPNSSALLYLLPIELDPLSILNANPFFLNYSFNISTIFNNSFFLYRGKIIHLYGAITLLNKKYVLYLSFSL